MIPDMVPVSVEFARSVAVTDAVVEAVFRVTPVKVKLPLSPAVKVWSAGSTACASLVVRRTVPR